MSAPNSAPSFWTGIAAQTYPFEDVADYSRWACGLLENGHDGDAIRILAGLDREDNLFELREWHRKAIKDLGREVPSESEAFLAHLRGVAEEHLSGSRDFHNTLQYFQDLYLDSNDDRLEPFYMLNLAWWDYDDTEWDFGPRANIPNLVRERCKEVLEMGGESQG